jgi:hypothetical protein
MKSQKEPQSDELNPRFIFSLTHTDLLVKAINGKIDLTQLAMIELANRGLDKNGQWVGFAEAKKIHGIMDMPKDS